MSLKLLIIAVLVVFSNCQSWEELIKTLTVQDKQVVQQASKELGLIKDAPKCAAFTADTITPSTCSAVFSDSNATCCFIKLYDKTLCSPFINYSVPIHKKLLLQSKGELICGNETVFDIVKLASINGLSQVERNELSAAVAGLVDYPNQYQDCVSTTNISSSNTCTTKVNGDKFKCCYFSVSENYIPDKFCSLVLNNVSPTYNSILQKIGGSMICDVVAASDSASEGVKIFNFIDVITQLSQNEQKLLSGTISKIPEDAKKCINVQNPLSTIECATIFYNSSAKCALIKLFNNNKPFTFCTPIPTELLPKMNDIFVKYGGIMTYKLNVPDITIPFKKKVSQLNQYEYMLLEKDMYKIYLESPREISLCTVKHKPNKLTDCSHFINLEKAQCCFIKDSLNNTYCGAVSANTKELYYTSMEKIGNSVVCGTAYFNISLIVGLIYALLL
jgi:hypothetical protein